MFQQTQLYSSKTALNCSSYSDNIKLTVGAPSPSFCRLRFSASSLFHCGTSDESLVGVTNARLGVEGDFPLVSAVFSQLGTYWSLPKIQNTFK